MTVTEAIAALTGGTRTRRRILAASIAAASAALAGVVLIGVSGWFLTSAALALAVVATALPGTLIRVAALVRTAGRYGERVLSHRAALLAMATLRARLFRRLAEQDTRSAPALSGGDASARLIGDIDALEALVVRRPLLAGSLAGALAGVAGALLAGWLAGLALALLLASLPLVIARLSRRLVDAPARAAAQALGDLRTRFVELAAARAEIAAYGIVARAADTLAPDVRRFEAARRALSKAEAATGAVTTLYGGAAVVLVLVLATSSAAFAALGALAGAAAAEAMASFAQGAIRNAGARESLDRLMALEAAEPFVASAVPEDDTLTLGDVRFAPGSRVAIAGASGSGKTMLLEQLAGLRPANLPLCVGGAPVSRVDAAELSGRFALAPQDAPLIAGTIAENLSLARNRVDEAAIWRALDVACLAGRVRAFPDGMETRVGEGGVALSGGERKRIGLARALLAQRPWLLLDEPTEGLDPATEAAVVARLGKWLDETGTGLLLTSHRKAPLALVAIRIDVEELRGVAA